MHRNLSSKYKEPGYHLRRAIRKAHINPSSHSSSGEFKSYREKRTEYYAGENRFFSKHDLIVATRGYEAISFILSTLVNPGDEVIGPKLLYANCKRMEVLNGIKIPLTNSRIEKNFVFPSIEAFEEKIVFRTKVILICNLNDLINYLYTEKELYSLKELIVQYDLFLLTDETYWEFVCDHAEHSSILQSVGVEKHAMFTDLVPKCYSMRDTRIGCITSKSQALITCTLKFVQGSLGHPSLNTNRCKSYHSLSKNSFEEIICEYMLRQNPILGRLDRIEGGQDNQFRESFYYIAKHPKDDVKLFTKYL